jgi:signal transduction histidine kinase
MIQAMRSPIFRYGGVITLLVLAAIFLLPGLRMGGVSPNNFLPHATCYLQDARLIWLHATTDSLIGLAYLAISATLGFLVYRARADIPFHWMFMAFGLFIVTCGLTHIMAVINVWKPLYWLSGDVKVVTATASVATAVALPFMVPRVFNLIRAAKLSEERKRGLFAANEELRTLYEKVKEVDELKSQFFANISHELRTPLTLVLGPAQKLRSAGTLSPEQLDDVEMIRRNASLLLKQVNDLLEASRLEAGKAAADYHAFDMAALVRVTCSNFRSSAQEHKVSFEVMVPSEFPVEADPEKVQRILLNLLGNAFKFVPAGGVIRCELRGDRGTTRIIVQDNGPGVPAHLHEAVFERFRQVEGSATRRFGGTGLGLSIARDLAELHGGSVDLSETPGGGATFTVTLPTQAPAGTPVRHIEGDPLALPEEQIAELIARPAPRSVDDSAGGDSRQSLVLIVEDDPDMNRFVAGILRRNYRVACAFNGREGLEKARQLRPEVILSDIMMPEMSGDQLLAAIRAEPGLAQTPFLLLSAKADDELRLRLLKEGASDYIMKPFTLEEVEARVANFVAIAQVRRTLQGELQVRELSVTGLALETVRRKKEAEAALGAQQKAEEALRQLNVELEERVKERTSELVAVNQEMESFTYSVSHDLRAPLRTISGMADMLLEDYATQIDPLGQDIAKRIVTAANRMDVLIEDLLHYARASRSAIQLKPILLSSAVEAARASLEREIEERQAEVTAEVPPVWVLAQESLLGQVLHNLLSNAMRYVAPGVVPRVRLLVEEADGTVRLAVQDNGIGIAAADQEKIFQLFKRLHSSSEYPGSGLGLAILAKAVIRMGGSYGVESAPGKGSCFWVQLPQASLLTTRSNGESDGGDGSSGRESG